MSTEPRPVAAAETLAPGLLLARPAEDDLTELHAIYSDPRVWTHLPSARHTEQGQTHELLSLWRRSWQDHGLGQWIVRDPDSGQMLGHGGCAVRGGFCWNLGYRFAAEAHGRGHATDVARAGLAAARAARPQLPVIAYLLEHNRASARVAEKVGLVLRHRGPDAGNPDPDAVRLIYSDRELADEEVSRAVE
ncbi:GNAT family N-acetyltransferase [Nesterenkonia sp. HG001]|uniref:GNAT family N-acetyltransferase n=1 Tax=Nesterenkonia sp. HG001 TaxID=2983207 RepID=UPI002AC6E7C8|nr:GNAT family N-acetyltransferase [Nesterenkonia sp. HG001]MDZ5077725.1 GNAT family N-acetyltransferase [Nesterenkonia sp. HG001]